MARRRKAPRRNPWPTKFRKQGEAYDRCLANVGPGYNPFAVCGASLKKTMGKKKFGEMLGARRRMAKRNPAWHEHPSLYAPTIHGQVRVQKPRYVGAPGPVAPVSGPVRVVRTKVIRIQNPTEPLDAEELVLFTINDGALYRHMRKPLEDKLLGYYVKGEYPIGSRAAPGRYGWAKLAAAGVTEYRRQIDRNADFSPREVHRAAEMMQKAWEAEMPHAAKYYQGPAGTRHNPRKRRR